MEDPRDLRLLRFATGEASEEERAELERELANDPALGERLERLRLAWDGLELPDPEPGPARFSEAVLGRLPSASDSGWGLAGSLRWAAAAALLGGFVFGAWLVPAQPTEVTRAEDLDWEMPPSLALDYWEALEETLPGFAESEEPDTWENENDIDSEAA